MEILRRALTAIPPLRARLAQTKSWMGQGVPPRVQLADWLDDVQTVMAEVVPTLGPTRLLATVTSVGPDTVTLRLQHAHSVGSQHTAFVDFIGQVWSFAEGDARTLKAGPEVVVRAAPFAGAGLPVIALVAGDALVDLL